jgi:hypothetical protein
VNQQGRVSAKSQLVDCRETISALDIRSSRFVKLIPSRFRKDIEIAEVFKQIVKCLPFPFGINLI